MIRKLGDGERDRFDSGLLAQLIILADPRPLARVERNAALQVRQAEGLPAVAAIGRSDQVEQGIILRDRHQLSGAKGPTGRGKTAAEHAYLANERLTHRSCP